MNEVVKWLLISIVVAIALLELVLLVASAFYKSKLYNERKIKWKKMGVKNVKKE